MHGGAPPFGEVGATETDYVVKFFCQLVFLTLALAVLAGAGEVVIRLTAHNRDETNRVVLIKAYLPPEVRSAHILDLDGAELAYDGHDQAYYVRAAPELPPGATNTFAVKLYDIWTIPTQYIDRIEQHVAALQSRLPRDNKVAVAVSGEALAEIRKIRARQASNAAEYVTIDKHVGAYHGNILALEQVVVAARSLEDILIGEGSDPGWLVPYFFKPKAASNPDAAGDRMAVIRISVTNTSPTESSTLEVRRDLPFAVSAADIISADGLRVEADPRHGICCVVTNGLQLAAQEGRTFNVTVRDRWNVNDDRMEGLDIALSSDLADVRELKRYASVEESLEQLISDLSDVREEAGPDELSAEYIAFYKDQSALLDAMEAMWKRIQRLEFPAVPVVRPPDRKQAGSLVYIIPGVLALAAMLVLVKSLGRKGGRTKLRL